MERRPSHPGRPWPRCVAVPDCPRQDQAVLNRSTYNEEWSYRMCKSHKTDGWREGAEGLTLPICSA